METNNQNLPPTPSLSTPPFFEETKEVNYLEKKTWFSRYKYIIILIAIFLAIFSIVIPMVFHKDAKNIQISGDQVKMTLGKSNISAELATKSSVSFLINSGKMSSLNTGEFAVWPMEKVKYLEQKYTDFIHCDSPGEEEGKSSLINIGLIAKTSTAEMKMRDTEKSVEKGNLVVVEIDGSELKNIQGLKREISSYGIFVVEKVRPDTYYLVDDLKIIKEKYQ